jgi:hypothetical protein
MSVHHMPWEVIFFGMIKLIKAFGLIPGAIAAFGVRKLYQKWRQNKAMAGWPVTDGTILSGQVHREGRRRYWAEIAYYYFVGEYRSGTYVRRFRKEEDADAFVRQVKEKRLQVRYSDANPEQSVILDRDLEMIVLLSPQLG